MLWKKGDIITQERFNYIKQSYAGLPKSYRVPITANETGITINITINEILELLKLGYILYTMEESESAIYIDYIVAITADTVLTQWNAYSVNSEGYPYIGEMTNE